MQRLFLIAWSAVVIIVIAIMVLISISLVPHFSEIGNVATVALFIVLGCGVSLVVAFTIFTIARWNLRRRLVTFADTGASFREQDGTWTHLSGIHHQMALPPPVTVKELPSGDPRWDAVMDLRKAGKGMHAIAKELKVPYQRVRTFLNQVEGNDEEQ